MPRSLGATPLDLIIGAGIVVVTIVIAIGCHVVSSYFEAQAYENMTGKQVSTWDAMFLELRVESAPAEKR